ncbi:AbrB family transcriptional regulator [Rhizobium mongolense]|uniref:AbrB family transcriptional regulator n=1 Tax=Rhizobium mongolense TaxID=57676 RepID=UPI000AEFE365|nr:AbrB family transcriptional regulator [Rhizobium mongolense]
MLKRPSIDDESSVDEVAERRFAVRTTVAFATTLGLGTLGAFAFWELHMPLPWLLGSMFVTSVAAIARAPISVPGFARPPMTAVIGTILGSSFHQGLFSHIDEWLIPLVGLVLFLITAGGASYLYFRKFAGFDHTTAYFAGMPGGLVEMVMLGTERGGDERMMALVHSARIFLVVMSLPFIFQAITGQAVGRGVGNWVGLDSLSLLDILWFAMALVAGVVLGTFARFPARYLLGPISVSGLLHYFGVTDFTVPTVILCVAQIVIGAAVGARFAKANPRTVIKVFALSVGSTAQLLSITVAAAFLVSLISDMTFEALVLAYSPGGLAEMSLMALSLHVEIPFVILHHVARVLLVVAGATAAFKLIRPRNSPKP